MSSPFTGVKTAGAWKRGRQADRLTSGTGVVAAALWTSSVETVKLNAGVNSGRSAIKDPRDGPGRPGVGWPGTSSSNNGMFGWLAYVITHLRLSACVLEGPRLYGANRIPSLSFFYPVYHHVTRQPRCRIWEETRSLRPRLCLDMRRAGLNLCCRIKAGL